jgi:predicted transcriptional regulator of viral defense system
VERKMIRKDSIPEFVNGLQSRGKYWFTKQEAKKSTGLNEAILTKSLWRLERKNRIARVKRGFYVIVPLEYSASGILPPSWFIDDLMRFIGQRYYVGLLSAAAIHGAAHQQPQEFQVIVPRVDRSIRAGRLHIRFVKKSTMGSSPIIETKTATGIMRVSDPAVTAIDLVGYCKQVGGLDRVAIVVQELKDSITSEMLVKAAKEESQLAFVQRLGWLLEHLGAIDLADPLHQYVRSRKPRYTPLDPEQPRRGFPNQPRWKLIENTDIEMES